MRKIADYLSDAGVVAGCCLGVGMLSGKEAQVFFGNAVNVIIFAVTFCLINVLFREYCRKNAINDTVTLAKKCFNRFSAPFGIGLALCCFVCVTTMLAGVNECLQALMPVGALPLYGVACATLAAIILSRGMKALKIANAISIALAVILLVVLFCLNDCRGETRYVCPISPVIYTLFSVTMSFGVLTKLGAESDRKKNIICSVIASAVLSGVTFAVMSLSDFSLGLPAIENITNPYLLAFTGVTLTLAAVTGVVANAAPIVERLKDVIPDEALCCVLTFALALALSALGFDFAVKAGYLIVGVIGGITVVKAVINLIGERIGRTKNARLP